MEGLMKWVIVVLSLAVIVGSAFQGLEGERLKSDLIGTQQFHSPSQIKELLINDKREDGRQRVYSVTLTLQEPGAPGVYKAEAEVIYDKVGSEWEIRDVGFTSLKKIE